MWLVSSRKARVAQPARRRPPTFRPRLEALENRCLLSVGLLDPGFGNGAGYVTTSSVALNDPPDVIAIQPDDKIVSVGSVAVNNVWRISVMRLNPNGSLDTSFDGDGLVEIKATKFGSWGGAVALQPDGKILLGGGAYASAPRTWDVYPEREYVVARLNANGSLDTTFGKNGLFFSNTNSVVEYVTSLAVLPGGAIVATGPPNWTAFKLSPSGALDKTFGTRGFTTIAPGSYSGTEDMTIAPNGDIVMVGYFPVSNDLPSGYQPGGVIVALKPNGQLDLSFNGTGMLQGINPAGFATQLYAVAMQGSQIVVAGMAWNDQEHRGVVARCSLTGALDATFGTGGFLVTSNTDVDNDGNPDEIFEFTAIAVEADGSLVVGGSVTTGVGTDTEAQFLVVGHLTADGAVDVSFGTTGSGFSYASAGRKIFGLALDSVGNILVCGRASSSDSDDRVFLRFTSPLA